MIQTSPTNIKGEALEFLTIFIKSVPSEFLQRLDELYDALIKGLYTFKDSQNCYILLIELTKKLNKQQDLIEFIMSRKVHWRSYNISDWNITSKQFEKAEYVGLENMGSTCYANSLLQQLFFIESFKEAVLSIGDVKGVLMELQTLFGVMNDKSCEYFCPKEFCDSMNVIPGVQEDVEEFLHRLFTKLEDTRILKDLFSITLSSKITCKKCNKVSNSLTPYYTLQLEVNHTNSIVESLQYYTKPEVLQGESAYNCSECNEKVIAEKQVKINKLPPFLFIELKRFIYKFGCEVIKLTNYCEFPFELNMSLYSEVEQDSIYILKGIIVHTGSANSGHYYSFIYDRKRIDLPNEKRWLKFDDKKVSSLDIESIPEHSFGNKSNGSPSGEKTNCAYILIYEKKSNLIKRKEINIERDLKVRLGFIREVNQLKKLMFSSLYENFMLASFELSKDYEVTYKAALVYLLTIGIHSMSVSESVYNILNMVKLWCNHIEVSYEVASIFTHSVFIKEFITVCPKEEARRIVVSILKSALTTLCEKEKPILKKNISKTSSRVLAVVDALLRELEYLPKPFCGQYFQLLSFIANLNEFLHQYLVHNLLLGVTLEILGAVTTTKCQERLKEKLEYNIIEQETILLPINDTLATLNDSDKIAQPKFLFELIYILLKDSLDIKELQEPLRAFQETSGLGNLFKAAEISKVALNFLSLSLKIACETKPAVYIGSIMKYICYKITSSSIKELSIYYNPLFKLFTTNDYKELLNTFINLIGKDFEIQAFTIASSYIDFIIAVYLDYY